MYSPPLWALTMQVQGTMADIWEMKRQAESQKDPTLRNFPV